MVSSPVLKIQRRARTELEGIHNHSLESELDPLPDPPTATASPSLPTNLKLQDFQVNSSEGDVKHRLLQKLNTYMSLKQVSASSDSQVPFLNVQDYMREARPTNCEKSNIVYLQVLDAKADSKDTIMHILHNLNRRFIEGQKKECLLVALKFEYGEELKWLLGDWHLLKNYQNAVMKCYFDAGLKELAQCSGYPVAAIQSCSNTKLQFKRTHHFLIEVWEALYRVILDKFLEDTTCSDDSPNNPLSRDAITGLVLSAIEKLSNSHRSLPTV